RAPFARNRCCCPAAPGRRYSAAATGIELPIGLVNATACRTTPGPEITSGALGTDFYCIRRRLDGGFTLALRNRGTVELSPDLFRYARAFLPTYRHRRKGLKLSFATPFFDH